MVDDYSCGFERGLMHGFELGWKHAKWNLRERGNVPGLSRVGIVNHGVKEIEVELKDKHVFWIMDSELDDWLPEGVCDGQGE